MKNTDPSVETLVEDRLSALKPADLNDVEKQSVVALGDEGTGSQTSSRKGLEPTARDAELSASALGGLPQ